jgi:hypothetical protein
MKIEDRRQRTENRPAFGLTDLKSDSPLRFRYGGQVFHLSVICLLSSVCLLSSGGGRYDF